MHTRVQAHLSPLRALPLIRRLMPADGSVDGLVAATAAHLGRPIHVTAVHLGARSSAGFWVIEHDRDLIVHPAAAVGRRRDLIICHELAHMLLGHGLESRPGIAGLAPGGPTRLLTRHGYGDVAEADALRLARHLIRMSFTRHRAHLRRPHRNAPDQSDLGDLTQAAC